MLEEMAASNASRARPGGRKRGLYDHAGESLFYDLFRVLVALATGPRAGGEGGGGVSRRELARELGVPFKTFEKWLSETEDQHPRWSVVCHLLAREDLVPASAALEVKALIAREWGLAVSPLPGPASETAGELPAAALGVAREVGKVAEAVGRATAPESDGGERITGREAAAIVRPAMKLAGGVEGLLRRAGEIGGGR